MPNDNWGIKNKVNSTLANIRQRMESNNAFADFYKVEDGKQVLRILPTWKKGEVFFREIYQHRNFSRSNPKDVVVCPKMTDAAGKPCPICEQAEMLFKTAKSKEDRTAAGKVRAKPRYLMNVLVVGKESEGPKILSSGPKLMEIFLTEYSDPDIGRDFTDPATGSDVLLWRVGDGFDTSYANTRVKEERKALKDSSMLKQLHDLDRWAVAPSYDALEAKLQGIEYTEPPSAEREEEPEEEPEAPGVEKEEDGVDLEKLDREGLKALIKENNLPLTVYKNMSDADIRKMVMRAVGAEDVTEAEQEPDMPEKEIFEKKSATPPVCFNKGDKDTTDPTCQACNYGAGCDIKSQPKTVAAPVRKTLTLKR